MEKGMVTAPQPEAVEAGLDALKQGGNAMDAALAAAFVQTAVDPQMCGIAGFGSMQVYMPGEGVNGFIDFHGRAPGAAEPDMWEDLIERECDDGFGFVLKGRVNEFGYGGLTTPMTLKAFATALERHGTMPLADILRPAIGYCMEGFAIRPAVHSYWMRPAMAGRMEHVAIVNGMPATRKIYTNGDGGVKKVGDILKNPDMGRTLQRIADESVDVFYRGGIADEIDADMRANGGILRKEDLAECEPTDNEPLSGSYRGYDVATNQLPGGGLMVLEMLNILENFDLAAMGHNSAGYIACLAEAMKHATIDKDEKMGDPRFVDVPVEELSGKDYAADIADRIRNGEKADVPRLNAGGPESSETTHVVAADAAGNIVGVTHSLGSGSGVVTEGLGFMYNNCMAVFDPRPGRAGSLAPGKSRFSAMCPTMLLRDGEPALALGAPGGTTITMGVLQTILNVVDFGMDAQQAVSAPRFCATSNVIEVTNRILRSVEAELNAAGYPTKRLAESYAPPAVHAIRIRDGVMDGGADPSRDGMAMSC